MADTRIAGFLIDVVTSVDHVRDNEITSYPVEDGADLTDNVRPLPFSIRMDAIVTNTPIGKAADERDTGSKPVLDFLALIEKIRNSREPIEVETHRGVFKSMALETFSDTSDGSTGDAIMFRATFRKIEIVTITRVEAPPRSKRRKNRGVRPAIPPTFIDFTYAGPGVTVTTITDGVTSTDSTINVSTGDESLDGLTGGPNSSPYVPPSTSADQARADLAASSFQGDKGKAIRQSGRLW